MTIKQKLQKNIEQHLSNNNKYLIKQPITPKSYI